ncbi:hypothetical protein KKG20_01530, partial [bacterium]|nr:hypothetical protein [bacterium]
MKGKIKVSIVIIEVLIALGILAVPLFWVQKIARAASTGKAMMAYREGAVDIPRYRIWTGSSWSAEAVALDVVGDTNWAVLRSCPKRNEKVLGVLDHLSDVNVQVWNGTTETWGNLLTDATTNTGTPAKRAFDIAYEQSSGDAIVVFSVDSNQPQYYSWNGSAWGTVAESAVAVGDATADIEWVGLASKPGADEIIMVTQDTLLDIYAQVWDGSAWGNAVNLTTATEIADKQCFDVAYEQSRKRAMVVYTTLDNNTPKYSMWDTIDLWVAGGSATPTATAGDDLRWVKLAARLGSNELLLGVSDDAYDLNVQLWYSGASETWSNATTEVIGGTLKSLPTLDFRCFNVAYESTSGEGMVVWSDDDETAEYCNWDGSSWSGGSTAMSATATYSVAWVALASNPD